ncbi:MAG: hypothetical protein H6627_08820 [Calditrichae bacterium]|nr:hypothetical protein [Calditrichia bacterium]
MTRMSLFLIILILGSCQLYEPSLPKWDTSWKIELQQDVIRISDIIDSQDIIKDSLNTENNKNTLFISISDTSEKQSIAEKDLFIKTSDQYITQTVGVFEIDKPDIEEVQGSTFSELFADLNPQTGMVLPVIEPRTIQAGPRSVVFDNFQEIGIESATLSIIFHNRMMVGIDNNMYIVLYDAMRSDDANGGVIDTISFDAAIPANSTLESLPLDLSGKSISNQINFIYHIPFSGTDSMMTLSQDELNSFFYTEVVMSSLMVSSALAKIPEQSFIRENTAPVDADDHTIQQAHIDRGKIFLQVENHLNLDNELQIKLPNFADKNGELLIVNDFIKAGHHKNIPVNLEGYTFQNENKNNTEIENIIYTVTSRTHSQDDFTWVHANDSVSVSVLFDTLYFDYLQGDLGRTEIPFEPLRKTNILDFADFQGSFVMPELLLQFNFHNQINYDIDVQLQVKGYKYGESRTTIEDSIIIDMVHTITPGESESADNCIVLDKKSSTPSIVDLMSIFPDEIVVDGVAYVEGPGSVNTGDKVWMDYTIDSPFELKINESLIIDSDKKIISEKDLDAEKRNHISENLTQILVSLSTENGLPVGSEFSFYVSADSADLFSESINDSTQKFILRNQIVAAKTDNQGYANATVKNEHTMELTKTQIALFEQYPVYYGFKVSLDPTDSPVRFRSADQLIYQPVLTFNVLMDPEKF